MRKGAAETAAPLRSIVAATAAARFHTHTTTTPTPPKHQIFPQSITDTHQKSAPPEGCPTTGQVRVRWRVAAATPWMQIWMLRGGVGGGVDPGGGWQPPALASC